MKFSLLILLIISANVSASEQRGSYLDFNFQRAGVSLEHEEKSSDAGFDKLGKTSNFDQNILSIIYGREFLSDSFISFSVFGSLKGGFAVESGEEAGTADNFDFKDNYSSYGGGIGAAININTTIFDERVQFFLSSESAKKLNNYFLRYSDDTTDDSSFEIEYKEEESVLISTLGLRVINLKNRFSSHFSVHVLSHSSDKFDAKASQGKVDFNLTQKAQLTKDNAAFSIGFGYFF